MQSDREHEIMSAGQLGAVHLGRALWVGGSWEKITLITHGTRTTVQTRPRRGYSSISRFSHSDSIAVSKSKVVR